MIELNTPWWVDTGREDWIRDAANGFITGGQPYEYTAPDRDEMYAIVHTVNAYPQLVEKLRAALDMIRDNGISECDAYEEGSELLEALALDKIQN